MLNDIDLPSFEDADSIDNPMIVAHFNHPSGAEWWIVSGEEQLLVDNRKELLLFGVAKITDTEMGVFALSEIENVGAVRDTDWTPQGLFDVFPQWR